MVDRPEWENNSLDCELSGQVIPSLQLTLDHISKRLRKVCEMGEDSDQLVERS